MLDFVQLEQGILTKEMTPQLDNSVAGAADLAVVGWTNKQIASNRFRLVAKTLVRVAFDTLQHVLVPLGLTWSVCIAIISTRRRRKNTS